MKFIQNQKKTRSVCSSNMPNISCYRFFLCLCVVLIRCNNFISRHNTPSIIYFSIRKCLVSPFEVFFSIRICLVYSSFFCNQTNCWRGWVVIPPSRHLHNYINHGQSLLVICLSTFKRVFLLEYFCQTCRGGWGVTTVQKLQVYVT